MLQFAEKTWNEWMTQSQPVLNLFCFYYFLFFGNSLLILNDPRFQVISAEFVAILPYPKSFSSENGKTFQYCICISRIHISFIKSMCFWKLIYFQVIYNLLFLTYKKAFHVGLRIQNTCDVCMFVFVCVYAFDLCGRNEYCFSLILFLKIEAHAQRIITNGFTFIGVQASPITLSKILNKNQAFQIGLNAEKVVLNCQELSYPNFFSSLCLLSFNS